jgi:drug/metabolite transporter (DMT)-like permease
MNFQQSYESLSDAVTARTSNYSNELICEIQICISIVLFGISFICQKKAMIDGIQPITYNACRYIISTMVLFLVKRYSGITMKVDKDDEYLEIIENDDEDEEDEDEESRVGKKRGNAPSEIEEKNGEQKSLIRGSSKKINSSSSSNDLNQSTKSNYSTFSSQSENEVSFFGVSSGDMKKLILFGLLIGVCNFGGSVLQQIGLVTVTAGKTAFITGMYVVFVPLVEFVFIPKYRENFTLFSVVAVLLALVGLYLLSGCVESEVCIGGAIKEGEIIVFISMLCWALSIITTDYAVKNIEVITLTCYQFSITTTLTVICAFFYESESLQYPFTSIVKNWHWILIVGITDAFAFALSTFGQMYTAPSRVAILFSFDAVLCALLGYCLLGEELSWIEVGGAFLMTAATFVSSNVCSAKKQEEESQEEETEVELVGLPDEGPGEAAKREPKSRTSSFHHPDQPKSRSSSFHHEEFRMITTQYYQHNYEMVCKHYRTAKEAANCVSCKNERKH